MNCFHSFSSEEFYARLRIRFYKAEKGFIKRFSEILFQQFKSFNFYL